MHKRDDDVFRKRRGRKTEDMEDRRIKNDLEKGRRKKLFISSFEVDTLNEPQVSSPIMMRMMMTNRRSAFLGWCCVFFRRRQGLLNLSNSETERGREKERFYRFSFPDIFHQSISLRQYSIGLVGCLFSRKEEQDERSRRLMINVRLSSLVWRMSHLIRFARIGKEDLPLFNEEERFEILLTRNTILAFLLSQQRVTYPSSLALISHITLTYKPWIPQVKKTSNRARSNILTSN